MVLQSNGWGFSFSFGHWYLARENLHLNWRPNVKKKKKKKRMKKEKKERKKEANHHLSKSTSLDLFSHLNFATIPIIQTHFTFLNSDNFPFRITEKSPKFTISTSHHIQPWKVYPSYALVLEASKSMMTIGLAMN